MNEHDYALLIHIWGVYDGWSVGVMPDGTMINRWDEAEYPERYERTRKFINIYGGKYEWKEQTSEHAEQVPDQHEEGTCCMQRGTPTQPDSCECTSC